MKVRLVMRKNRSNQQGQHPISLKISHRNRVKYYSTGLNCHAGEWDSGLQSFNSKAKSFRNKNIILQAILEKAETILTEMYREGVDLTFGEFDRRYTPIEKNMSLVDYVNDWCRYNEKSKSYGTISAYKGSLKAWQDFNLTEDISFKEIDLDWIKRFELTMLSKENPTNPFRYLKELRTMFNNAEREEIISSAENPFKRYSLGHLKKSPNPLYLSIDQVKELINWNPTPGSADWKAKNYFLFSLHCRGMNFSDMAELREEHIIDGHISIKRKKVDTPILISVNDDIGSILKGFESYAPGKDGYLFPIYHSGLDTGKKKDFQKRKYLSRTNERLRAFGKDVLEIKWNLSHGKARHTFANLMKNNKRASQREIQELLNHSDPRTTEHYLGRFPDAHLNDLTKNLIG